MKPLLQILGAILLILIGGGLLVITYFFTFAVVWVAFDFGIKSISVLLFNQEWTLSSRWIRSISLAFLVLLFIENFRVDPEYWRSYVVKHRIPGSISWTTGSLGSLITLLANAGASSKVIVELLLSGPRLITKGFLLLAVALKFLLKP